MTSETRPKTCAIHQPNFLARNKTLAKIAAADVLVVLDNVQFNRSDYQNRALLAPLRSPDCSHWFSWSVHLANGRDTRIDRLEFACRGEEQDRLRATLHHYYSRSPYYVPTVEHILEVIESSGSPSEMWTDTMLHLLSLTGWRGEVVYASNLPRVGEDRSARLINLVREVGACTYLCGTGGRSYLDLEKFRHEDIEVVFSPIRGSASRVSGVDSLMRYGIEPLTAEIRAWRASMGREPAVALANI